MGGNGHKTRESISSQCGGEGGQSLLPEHETASFPGSSSDLCCGRVSAPAVYTEASSIARESPCLFRGLEPRLLGALAPPPFPPCPFQGGPRNQRFLHGLARREPWREVWQQLPARSPNSGWPRAAADGLALGRGLPRSLLRHVIGIAWLGN